MKQSIFDNRNYHLRLLDSMSRLNRNVVAKGGESLEHFLKKAEVSFKLMQSGLEIVTEAKFKNGSGKADIFVLDTGETFYIKCHRKNKEIEKKEDKRGMVE